MSFIIMRKIISAALLCSLKNIPLKDQQKTAGLIFSYINSKTTHLDDNNRAAIFQKMNTEINLLAENKKDNHPGLSTPTSASEELQNLYLKLNNYFLFFPNQYQAQLKTKTLTVTDITQCLAILSFKLKETQTKISIYQDPQEMTEQIKTETTKLQKELPKELQKIRSQLKKIEQEVVKKAFLFFIDNKKSLNFICHKNVIDYTYNQVIKDKYQRKKIQGLKGLQILTQKTIQFFAHYNITINKELLPNNYGPNIMRKLITKNGTLELNLFINYLKEIYLLTLVDQEYHDLFKKILLEHPLQTDNIALNNNTNSFLENNFLTLFKKGVLIKNFTRTVLSSVYKNVWSCQI